MMMDMMDMKRKRTSSSKSTYDRALSTLCEAANFQEFCNKTAGPSTSTVEYMCDKYLQAWKRSRRHYGMTHPPCTSSHPPPTEEVVVVKEASHPPPTEEVVKEEALPIATTERNHPPWIARFRELGASDGALRRVLSKVLTVTDTDEAQHRFQLSLNAVADTKLLEELTEEERADVVSGGLEVAVVDGEGRHYVMTLKRLQKGYRLFGRGWGPFKKDNDLKPRLHTIHICAFRVGAGEGEQQQLQVAILKSNTDDAS